MNKAKHYKDFSSADFNSLNVFFANSNWSEIFSKQKNVNEAYNTFLEVIFKGIKKFVPIKTLKCLQQKYPIHIVKLIKYRNNVWQKTIMQRF